MMDMTDYMPHLQWIDGQESRMIDLLTRWANVNSGTQNLPGLNELLTLLEEEFSKLGGENERIALEPQQLEDSSGTAVQVPLGRALLIRKRTTARFRVLLCCHMDTVYAADHLFQKSVRIDDGTLRGPGVTDAKGGIVVMLAALQAFERCPWAEKVGWEVLINPDEEIGSPGSATLLIQALEVVFRPSLGTGTWWGHAGLGELYGNCKRQGRLRGAQLGRNAIDAGPVHRVSGLSDSRCDNHECICQGRTRECGPDLATCRFNVRAMATDDQRPLRTASSAFRKKSIGSGISLNFMAAPRLTT
jgi:glutamate carboxypeptidase